MSGLRKIQVFSVTVLMLAGLSMSAPAAALGGGGGECHRTWCHDACPEELAEFCESKNCEGPGSTCEVKECTPIDPEEEKRPYTITCSSPD